MTLLFETINNGLMAEAPLETQRLPTFYPSAASCINEENGQVIGTCLRAQWFRCKGYEESNPPGLYSQFIFAAGIMWEKWLTEQFKAAGLFLGSSLKHQDLKAYVSGEIDILIRDPDMPGKKIIIEAKTYGAGNYSAKRELVGMRAWQGKPAIQAHPKDQNLLQAFLYLIWFKDQNVSKTIIPYLDRSCSGPDGNAEFHITYEVHNNRHYPVIQAYKYVASGDTYVPVDNGRYVDRRVSFEGIMERYADLLASLKSDLPPPAEYKHVFTDEEVIQRFNDGDIAKTKYEKWQSDPAKNKIGDWQCSYCNHSDTCKAFKDEEGVM